MHKTDRDRNKRRLIFAAEYFDFQPACLSQFEYETNVYSHWEASRFWNRELNLNIFVLFEAVKANKFYHHVFIYFIRLQAETRAYFHLSISLWENTLGIC